MRCDNTEKQDGRSKDVCIQSSSENGIRYWVIGMQSSCDFIGKIYSRFQASARKLRKNYRVDEVLFGNEKCYIFEIVIISQWLLRIGTKGGVGCKKISINYLKILWLWKWKLRQRNFYGQWNVIWANQKLHTSSLIETQCQKAGVNFILHFWKM